jgi:osmotically-inducible protein OsmY
MRNPFRHHLDLRVTPNEAYRFLSSVHTLPVYLPFVQRVRMDREEHITLLMNHGGRTLDWHGYFRVSPNLGLVEWGSDSAPEYHGWMQVQGEDHRPGCRLIVSLQTSWPEDRTHRAVHDILDRIRIALEEQRAGDLITAAEQRQSYGNQMDRREYGDGMERRSRMEESRAQHSLRPAPEAAPYETRVFVPRHDREASADAAAIAPMTPAAAGVTALGGLGMHAGSGKSVRFRRSDARLLDEICERMTDHPDLDATHIEVAVREAEVTLAGSVEDRRSKRLAEQIAEGVRGIRDVHNHLRVGTASNTSPSEIPEALGVRTL